MAFTEQPFGSLDSGGGFTPGARSLRSSWANSLYIPPDQHVNYELTISPGVVANYSVTVPTNVAAAQTLPNVIQFANVSVTGQFGGSGTGFKMVYIDANGDPRADDIATPIPSFPNGAVPVAVVVMDQPVNRIQKVIDYRPSYLTSVPDLGSGMKESIADPTRRVYFQQNFQVPRTFSLSSLIPADVATPCSGFPLGGGAVVIGGNTITTPTRYFSSTRKVANPDPIYQFVGSLGIGITQAYVDPASGQLATRGVQVSGVFPPNCLPIFEATVDGANRVIGLQDMRPSYLS